MRGAAPLMAALTLIAGCSAPATETSPAPPPSSTDNARIRGVLEEAGLIGTWGVNCAGPLDSVEWERIAVEADGVVRTHLGGGDQSMDYLIIDAVRTGPGEVKATVQADSEKLVVVYRLERDRQMTWSSFIEGGQTLITDGVSISGRRSAWYNRCPGGMPR